MQFLLEQAAERVAFRRRQIEDGLVDGVRRNGQHGV
jgi:hypothetical protein